MPAVTAQDKVWSFRGLSFARIVGGDQFQRQPAKSSIRSIEPLLDTNDRYVDTGGYQWSTFQLTAAFDNFADASTLLGYLGTTGQLVRTGGWAGNRLLAEATYNFVAPGLYVVDCTFE